MVGERRFAYQPALDGVRAVSIAVVLAFHLGAPWMPGGYLGVSVFFTLSGFLITSLLLEERATTGRIAVREFYVRRMRRLLPASLLCLAGIAVLAAAGVVAERESLRGDVLGGLLQVANWRALLADQSYGDLFRAPSPVAHFWSLAIEEQFYVVYPLLAYLVLRFTSRKALTGVLLAALGASVVTQIALQHNLDRVYYGTDTRMAELLTGALLAVWWTGRTSRGEAPKGRPARFVWLLIGAAGLTGTIVMWPTVGQTDPFLVQGALPLQAVLSMLTIAAAARPGLVASLLAIKPLTALGLVSYGLYLYHWPVFLVLDEERTGLDLVPLFAVRMAATGALALLSFYVLEQPIRRRRLLVVPRTVAPAAFAGVAAVVVAAVMVTQSIPTTALAHADVDIEDQTITVVTSPSTTSTTGRIGGRAAPQGLMIVGDSGTYDAAPAIGAAFQHLGTATVVDASFPGFGLSRNPDGWRDDWPKLVREHDVELAVVMLGGWDTGYIDEHGILAYGALMAEATEILTAGGGHVLWLGMLPGPDTETADMNRAFRLFAENHPGGVEFGLIDEALRGPDGGYPRWVPNDDGELVLARKPDGWHLCPDGAARIAEVVVDLTADAGWSPRLRAGWEDGDWRTTERYDDPPKGCDTSLEQNAP